MGYIIPVERFQYNDYHIRQVDEKLQVSNIQPSFKVVLEKKHEEIAGEYHRLLPTNYKNVPLKPHIEAVQHATYSEITGKGSMFNASI